VEDDASPASSVHEKRSISSPELEHRTFSVEESTEVVYDPPLELQIPSTMELSDSPLPSPASSPSTESDLNSPEFQPSSIVSRKQNKLKISMLRLIYKYFRSQCSIQQLPTAIPAEVSPRKRPSIESTRMNSICSNLSLSRQSSRGSGQDSVLGLSRQRSQDTETALSPLRKNSQDGFLAQMDKVDRAFAGTCFSLLSFGS